MRRSLREWSRPYPEQLTELVHCGATPEKMQIIVEIAVLENSMRREEA